MSMRDDELVAALADLGGRIAYPHAADLSGAVVSRLHAEEPRPRHGRARALAIAVAVIVVVVLALPAPRHAVADWLGFSSVHIVRVDSLPPGLGTTLRLGREVSAEEARGQMPFTVMAPTGLGPPAKAYVGEPIADAVTLVWPPSPQTPEVAGSGVGLLLTEYPGSVDRFLLEKRLDPTTSVDVVNVGEVAGYWISGGRHELFYVGPDGQGRPDTTRLAGNTLIWSKDGVVFRMESSLDPAAAVHIASGVAPF
jgi:hypothetical protein